MAKVYRISVRYPSGLAKVISLKPGSDWVTIGRACGPNGKLLDTVTLESKSEGGYVCVETGKQLRVLVIKIAPVVTMERAMEFIALTQENRLGFFCSEWPCEVRPVDEYYPELLAQQASDITLSDDERSEYARRLGITGISQSLSGDPGKMEKGSKIIVTP